MSYYIFLYTISIVLSILSGALIFRQYRNLSGLFFFLFTVFVSTWFLLYFLFFSGISDVPTLLLLSRLNFGIGLGATYSLLFFLYFFDVKPSRIWSKKFIAIVLVYLSILALHTFTDLVVGGLAYIEAEHIYRETQGSWYLLNGILHLTGVLLFIWVARIQLAKQMYLNRVRLSRILFSAYGFMLTCLFLQLILPTFGIWILEKEIIFIFALFILYTYFTIKRYYFSSLGYGTGKIVIFLSSIVFSILFLNILKWVYLSFNSGTVTNYWISGDRFSIIDTTLGIFFFMSIYRFLEKQFLAQSAKVELKNKVRKLEKNISFLTYFPDLERYLRTEIKGIFKTSFCQLQIFPVQENKNDVQKYFENSLTDKIFINDIVFIEENKNRFHKDTFLSWLPKESFLVLPIFDTDGNTNIGIFIVGVKSFGDFYTIDEIDVLRDFVSFLELHLKYIRTYELLQDLSINLDKKVDEKTIEYNNLVNKQKEFISVISHEIKSPIANAIFQADSIIDDVENGDISTQTLKEELDILNGELLKAGELTTRLFSMQYFDTRSVVLFKERIQVGDLLNTEYQVYSHMHENIKFVNLIDENTGFIEIDKIQFQQVVTNLLQNAVKFLDKKESVIIIETYKRGGFFHMIIEDNGRGFQGINTEHLFDRYSTGSGESIGLGMGLYLCKKIIDMHNGTLTADVGDRLGGARFTIQIPLS